LYTRKDWVYPKVIGAVSVNEKTLHVTFFKELTCCVQEVLLLDTMAITDMSFHHSAAQAAVIAWMALDQRRLAVPTGVAFPSWWR
jgi:hypothetical protein